MSGARPICRRPSLLVPLLLAPLLLAGCGDPYEQPGTWHPTGINQANIDAEATDKADTVAGHGTPGSDGVLADTAVQRLYQDKEKPLKNESSTGGTGS